MWKKKTEWDASQTRWGGTLKQCRSCQIFKRNNSEWKTPQTASRHLKMFCTSSGAFKKKAMNAWKRFLVLQWIFYLNLVKPDIWNNSQKMSKPLNGSLLNHLKVCMCFCWVSCLIHPAFLAHIVWYSENMEEKQLSFIQRLKLSRNMQFDADAT